MPTPHKAPPRLATPRLILRGLEEADLDDVVRIVGNFEVSKWLVPVPHPYTAADARAFLDDTQQGRMGLIWVIEFEGRFAGLICVGPGLGYWLYPTLWGRGLTTEAARVVLDYYFETTDAAEVLSCFFEGNTGSEHVLTKVGFEPIGPGTSHSLAQGKDVPAQRIRLTRGRWLPLRSQGP